MCYRVQFWPVPVTVSKCPPSLHSAVQWLLAIVGAGLSGAVIVLTLLPVLKANAAKESINLWTQQIIKFEIAVDCKKYLDSGPVWLLHMP